MFTVVERRPISDELIEASTGWLSRNGLDDELDASWLELVCEDGDVFKPGQAMLHLAVPPCEVAPGDSVDAGRTQGVAELFPEPGAPADAVPRLLAVALTFERGEDAWIGVCELPGPTRELFTVEPPDAMLAVMTATRRTLNQGMMSISGDPSGKVTFTVVEGNAAAWASTEAQVPESFTYWLDARPATALATPLKNASRAVAGLGELSDLIIINDQGVRARCLLDDERAAPARLAEDHFETHAHGSVEGLSIDRAGGLGRDALVAIANLRPHEVTFALAGNGSLVISGGPGEESEFELEGPGFAGVGDRPNAPIVVPYVVALAVHDGAAGGTVELVVDAQWGRLHRADQGITVEWRR